MDVAYLGLGKVFNRISYRTVVSRLGHHGEEGQRDGEELEHLSQEEGLAFIVVSLEKRRLWGHS